LGTAFVVLLPESMEWISAGLERERYRQGAVAQHQYLLPAARYHSADHHRISDVRAMGRASLAQIDYWKLYSVFALRLERD